MNKTPCETCTRMKCRTNSADCFNVAEPSKEIYHQEPVKEIVFSASRLVDNGRAGTLTRVQELVEYCKDRGFKRIGLAYCFGMAPLADAFVKILKENGFQVLPVTCTAGGIKEKEIDPSKTTETTSCNPAGQALVMNRLKPELVVEMGLCLGHDIVFHQVLEVPHTVLVVKDRVLAHNPASYLSGYQGKAEQFLKNLDNSFQMKSPDWLSEQMSGPGAITILDLRNPDVFLRGHIKGSVNITLKDLPKQYHRLDRTTPIVCVCNGSVQSAYAVMYLTMKGFDEAYNLSGGFSRWQRENREIED